MEISSTKDKKQTAYKDTPIGKIPADWEVKEFEKLAELSKSKYNPNSMQNYPCIELENIEQETGIINGYFNSIEQKSIKNKFNVGQILFGKLRPYLKKYWLTEFEGVCSSEIWVLSPKNDNIINEYLYRLIQSEKFIQVANVSSGSKMPRADWEYVSHFPFPLPPLSEQKRIAEVLSTWDQAIQLTEQLIRQKEQRKKWLMQNLLTGKMRLKGFSGTKWEDIELGEVLDYEQPTKYIVKNTNYSDSYSIPVLTAGKTLILGYTNEKDGIYSKLPVILFDDFTTASRYVNFPFKVKSSAIKLLKPKIQCCFKYIFEAMQMIKYTIGGHERHWISKYAYLTIPFPSLEEQTAIAEVLQTADKEIELLKAKAEKLKEQKKGLMQQLLTGKKRLL